MPRRRPGRGIGPSPATRRQVNRAAQKRQRKQRRKRRRRILLGGAIVVGGGALAYKLTRGQAKQIEEKTGMPVDELSDEEIQSAMTELGMQGEPLTAAEQAEIAGQPVEGATATDAEPAYMTELKQLAALRDQGILTEDEFQSKKKQLLGI